MEDTKFKFEPIWVSVISVIPIAVIYQEYKTIVSSSFWLNGIILFTVVSLFVCIMILPLTFKIITGIPAILLTNDQLVDNVVGVNIDWSNIEDIRITGIQKPFLTIILKDTDLFYSSINNPVKKILLRFLFLISPGDVSVNLALVAGDNDSIASMAQVYWQRYYGVED